jgi:Putative lumazine-binding
MGDRQQVEQTARDYFEGWYDGDVERMDRALHANLVKRRGADELSITTKERMLELTAAGAGRSDGEQDPQIEVTVHELYDNIALVSVDSAVYREYLHLVRTDEGWKIANALWQLKA